MTGLFMNLIVAHILGDFFFQTAIFCQRKQKNGLFGIEIYLHAIILFALSWFVVWNSAFWWAAFVIAVGHLVFDTLKITLERKINVTDSKRTKVMLGESRFAIWSFLLDQLLHIGIIIATTYWWLQRNDWSQFAFIEQLGMKPVLFVIALMICSKPANLLIRYILGYFKVEGVLAGDRSSTFKSGALIGTLERWLIVFFICMQQYEAIGFLIAAKSILRFNETKEREKSEYVLAGTLLSLTIALVCGWIVFIQY